GSDIAFGRWPQVRPGLPAGGRTRPAGLMIMRPDGSGVRRIWTCPDIDCQRLRSTWSPDGTRLALPADPFEASIAVVPVTGGRPHTFRLCHRRLCGSITSISWSPDGKELLFAVASPRRHQLSGLYIAFPDGTGLRKL